VHVPTGDNTDDSKNSLYDEVEQLFNQFSKYRIKISLGNFNAKLGTEDISQPFCSTYVRNYYKGFIHILVNIGLECKKRKKIQIKEEKLHTAD
jgi:hypothetical protein